jgi:hypothetical protein
MTIKAKRENGTSSKFLGRFPHSTTKSKWNTRKHGGTEDREQYALTSVFGAEVIDCMRLSTLLLGGVESLYHYLNSHTIIFTHYYLHTLLSKYDEHPSTTVQQP